MTIPLNGIVEFEQTQTAFPPDTFSRKIAIPGLIDLAYPAIKQEDAYFDGTYKPMYSWYKKEFFVDTSYISAYATLKLLKSSYGTTIFINGIEAGNFMQCNTPIDCDVTPYIHFGQKNELLIRLGDRTWLPKEAATGYDREKFSEIPGIWDDVFIEFSGPIKIHRLLALPDCNNQSLKIKYQLENYARDVDRDMELAEIGYDIQFFLLDHNGMAVSDTFTQKGVIQCQYNVIDSLQIAIEKLTYWDTKNPSLYQIVGIVTSKEFEFKNYGNTDARPFLTTPRWHNYEHKASEWFGKRCFTSDGKDFYLNGERIFLTGSTITLNRFFEDRKRQGLPWDSVWVQKLLVDIPKKLGWNFFRVSLGLLPKSWYDLADRNGILIQNEYPMWNIRGRDDQYEKEYTDWIWSDGNHPSIIIWDALNEQKHDYIGRKLIPKLKKLDPTRLRDLGFMKGDKTFKLDMTEVHWYPLAHGWWVDDTWYKNHFTNLNLGKLSENYSGLHDVYHAETPIIVNEFGWVWQSRDLKTSGIRTSGKFPSTFQYTKSKNYEYFERDGQQLYEDRDVYDHFLGKQASTTDRQDFQSYILALESEIIRSCENTDGIASFAYLSNDYGYTGDWMANPIKDLTLSQSLLCQYHTSQASSIFIDLDDMRYINPSKFFKPNENITLPLVSVNTQNEKIHGHFSLYLIDDKGRETLIASSDITMQPFEIGSILLDVSMPSVIGGYMLLSKFSFDEKTIKVPQMSRRYLRVGAKKNMSFPIFNYPKL
ncbi:MAG: glycoside hydrolase family 2 TIM barrel-domain containing protein [Saprospiraceae bacterium]